MEHGALVMMDALGFRGIWKRHDPEQVLKKLLAMSATVTAALPPTSVNGARFLSDTLVVGVAASPSDALHGLIFASAVASRVMSYAVQQPPELAFRGSISFGEFALQKNFFVGPAVDEAAELMALPEGAFVVLTPGARDALLKVEDAGRLRHHSMFAYPVPLKGGGTLRTLAVTPWSGMPNEEERRFVMQRMLSTFVGGLDVDVKRGNTLEFLESALAAIAPWRGATET